MKFVLISIMLCLNNLTLAKQTCQLSTEPSKNNDFVSTWQWSNHTLVCGGFNTDSVVNSAHIYQAKDLWVIRGHESTIDAQYFNVIEQNHGYHLVEKTTAWKPSILESSHHHMDVIALNDFKSITQPLVNRQQLGSAATTQFVNAIDATRWREDIVTLSSWSRRTGEAGNVTAANWIETQLADLGYQVSQQTFQVGNSATNNIVAIKPGSSRPNDWYIVGAHMDAIPSGNAPGAVDNASGCSAVLEIATVASEYNFEGTVIFICFSGEEQGLIGSNFHASGLVNDGNDEKIKLALTLDMVGYTSNTDHELLLESSSSYQSIMNEMAQLSAVYAADLTVYTSTNYFGSDHVSYIDNGMPGLLSIDDDWNVYPGYHNSTDLPENINLNQGEYILRVNAAMLAEKAKVELSLIFKDGFE